MPSIEITPEEYTVLDSLHWRNARLLVTARNFLAPQEADTLASILSKYTHQCRVNDPEFWAEMKMEQRDV